MSKSEGTAAGVGDRARTAIRGSAMAQRDIAARIGLDESKLSKSLGGTRRFSGDELLALATATGVTVQWLLTGDGEPTGPTGPTGPATSDTHGGAATVSGAAVPAPGTLPARHEESEEHALTRRTLVEQAWWLFAEHGYDGVRICDIAQAAGVSSASVHYYFPSKRDVFAEALRYSVKLAFDRQSARLAEAGEDPIARLKALVRLQLPADRMRRAEWSIWLQTWSAVAVDGDRFEHAGSYHRWWETVRGVLAEACAAGACTDDPDRAADALTAYIDGLGIRVLTGLLAPEDMAARVDHYIDRNITNHTAPATGAQAS